MFRRKSLSASDAGEAFLSLFGSDTTYDTSVAPAAAPVAACPLDDTAPNTSADSSAPNTSDDGDDEEAEAPRSSSVVEEVVFQPRVRKRTLRRFVFL